MTNAEKGYFPHYFNRIENDNYVGPYPDKEFYGYATMSNQERAAFDEWYNTVSDKTFDFKKELAIYGKNDVVLLREVCMKYREELILCAGLDPFNYTTLASTCMAVYKTHYIPKDTVALTRNAAYTNQNKTYSNVSIEWLEYIQKSRSIDIQHALNGGEVSIGKYYVDGFHDDGTTKKAFEFLGCFFHGCERCHNPADLNPLTKLPYSVLRRQCDDKFEILERAYNLQTERIWQCEWEFAKQTDNAVIEFMSTYKHPERLKPRDALYGGRTNALKLFHKAVDGEIIRYFDFTSLYPYVQARKTYPAGHPQIIHKEFQNLEDYYGLIKATVIPPRKLLHPVLPFRSSGKLLFPLCRTCAEQQNQTQPCVHSDEEAIHGCWVSIELLKAVEKGYVVSQIHEVWHFPQRTDTLFCDYVKTFLQLKQESSGYPKDVVTDADKESYIRDYFEKEGIKLNPDKI
ncbi:MAG: DNA polymerase [Lactococcus garvieae]